MSEFSLPQQGILVGDASRAPYDADEWSIDYTASLLGFAHRANYGVILGYDNGVNFSLEVTPSTVPNTNVELKIGAAAVRGTIYVNNATLTLAVQPNVSGNPRIDTVVIRKDYIAQTVRAAILQGAPAATPVAPTLTQSATTIWEIPIADLSVINGFTAIDNPEITPRSQFVNVGAGSYSDLVLNDSGVTLYDGDVVIWKEGTAKAVTTTTTPNHWLVAGVWRGVTANGAYGRIQTKGFGKIRIRAQNLSISGLGIKVGTPLVTSTIAKYSTHVDFRAVNAQLRGAPATGTSMATVGYLMEVVSVSSLETIEKIALAYIDVEPRRSPATTILKSTGTANAGTFTSGSWVARLFNTDDRGLGEGVGFGNNYVSNNAGTGNIIIQPGRYRIRGYGAGYRCDGFLARLQNTSNGSTVVVSTPGYSPSAADSTQAFAELETFLVIEGAATFQFQQRCTTTRATDGLGKYVGFSAETVTFAQLEITRMDEVLAP